MKFALFALALSSVACYTKQVTYTCSLGSNVNICNSKLKNIFPGSTWTVKRIMGEGTWLNAKPPTCAEIRAAYAQNCQGLATCITANQISCLPIN